MKYYLVVTLVISIFFSCNESSQQPATSDDHKGHASPSVQTTAGLPDYADSVNQGIIATDTLKSSPHRTAMANIGKTHIHIEYGSPGVKGRVIWGGLVPFETVWVTGAHKATTINFSKDVEVQGKKIPAGTYAFFTIPDKEKWILILNSRYDQHLADDYKQEEDLVRVEVTPVASDKLMQRLQYAVNKITDTSGIINMEWEKVKVSLPVVVMSE